MGYMILLTIVVFIGVFAAIVLVHEWGHFVTARKADIKVEEFGFGFPPKMFSFKKNDVVYSINWIPLGGFVKIYGEDADAKGEEYSFGAKSILTRSVVILAGVTMNFVLAIVLLSFGFWYGVPQAIDEDTKYAARDVHVTIIQTAPESPAQKAGIKIGDALTGVAFAGVKTDIAETKAAQDFIAAHKGQEISLFIQRGSEMLEKKVTPRENAPENQGAMGVVLEKTGIVSYPWYLAPVEGVKTAFSLAWLFLSAFGQIIANVFTQGEPIGDIAGPVGIAMMTYQVTQLGFSYIIQFAVILSINLAIINALPFPALDGGRFLFLMIEAIKGSPLSRRVEQMANASGFVFLMLLMLLITVRDVMKLF